MTLKKNEGESDVWAKHYQDLMNIFTSAAVHDDQKSLTISHEL